LWPHRVGVSFRLRCTSAKRAIVPALYLGLILFMCGVALAYFIVLPMTFKFMQSFLTTSLRQQIVVGPYISVVTKVLLAFGAVFEMPVVVMVLSALGLVSSRFLASKRRFALAGSAIMACILTPGDAVTISVFMMGPIVLLYELSIGLARLMERRRKAAEGDRLPSVAMIALWRLLPLLRPGASQRASAGHHEEDATANRAAALAGNGERSAARHDAHKRLSAGAPAPPAAGQRAARASGCGTAGHAA
jgi:hypothetical protein